MKFVKIMLSEALKSQLITWGIFNEDEPNAFKLVVGSLFILHLLEKLPEFVTKINAFVKSQKVKPPRNGTKFDSQASDKESKQSSIEFHYHANHEDPLIESLLEYICKQDETVFLRYSNNYKPSNENTFSLNYKDVFCKIKTMDYTTDGKLILFVFDIFSSSLKLKELHEWIGDIKNLYEINKKNQLGNKKYFFKEFPLPPMKDNQGNYIWNSANPKLKFTMTEFSTNKNLTNIFGEHIEEIKQRVDLFMNHPEWYQSKGIPRTLGLLLYGPPGSGKTSTIKAIANDTDKHIIRTALSDYTTKEQLNNLFFSETIEVHSEGRSHFYKIPLNQRMYVFEDVDCLGNIVQNRETRFNQPELSPLMDSNGNHIEYIQQLPTFDDSKSSPAIDLNYLLNLFDGILETPERLLIMSSNHPNVLDPALIRPGRIDINVEFSSLTDIHLKEMFDFFYKDVESYDSEKYQFDPELFNKKLLPARVTQILGTYYKDPQSAYKELESLIKI